MVKLAQLVRASDCGSEGRGFESHISPFKKRSDESHCVFSLYVNLLFDDLGGFCGTVRISRDLDVHAVEGRSTYHS